MTSTAVVRAPAKLNLGLRVVGRRRDGYHLLESVFVPLGLADRIALEVGPAAAEGGLEIKLDVVCDPGLGATAGLSVAAENLAVKAARQFFETAGLSGSVSIRLEKSIPIGAGLGGGSSDAGAVLRALDRWHPGAFSRPALRALAADLGADVPFFLAPEPAVVRGIGEQISQLPGLPQYWLLLANPGQSLATAEVFEKFARAEPALTLARTRYTMRALEGLDAGPRAAEVLSKAFDSGLLENDLEPVATSLCPQIGELRARLGDLGARWTAMSGSGATVYGIFADESQARSALERADFETSVWACVTRTQGQPKAWRLRS